MNQLDLQGKIAIVTGGAKGIGFAITKRLIASGAKVSIWDQDEDAIASAKKSIPTLYSASVNVIDYPQIQAALQTTLNDLGKIDILVSCAGIAGPNVKTWEYPIEDWNRVLQINLTGIFLCSRAVVPHMIKNDYGRIVNIASVAGKEGNPNAPAYSASKAGVISLTKSLGKELAKTGIRVNCVAPAVVKTELFSQMTQEHIDYMLSKIPMGRFGEVDEVAAMVAWLCTEECSFTTGSVFDLSGGRATY